MIHHDQHGYIPRQGTRTPRLHLQGRRRERASLCSMRESLPQAIHQQAIHQQTANDQHPAQWQYPHIYLCIRTSVFNHVSALYYENII